MIQALRISSNQSVIKMSMLMQSYYRTPGTGWCNGQGKDERYNQWSWSWVGGREGRINAKLGQGETDA